MEIDHRLAYWTWAWANMLLAGISAARGVGAIRRKERARHRRHMLFAVAGGGLFLVSYPIKLAVLGREALERWPLHYVRVLRLHELAVLIMCVTGGLAIRQALRLGLAEGPRDADPQGVCWHRRFGRLAVAAMGAGILTAAWVLHGMFLRA